jgi:V/A-type H+-transporting ATPase subunit D
MNTLKLTKNELKSQQIRLQQLHRYLPTLKLKKSLLEYEVANCLAEVSALQEEYDSIFEKVEPYSSLLLEKVSINLSACAAVQHVKKRYENIAGVEIPIFESISFRETDYFLFDTPAWTESAAQRLQSLITEKEKLSVAREKKRALEKELRDVSIRVNLFEKVLIPRAIQNIKKIRIFLGDQQLAVVAQAKVAKAKILARKAGP